MTDPLKLKDGGTVVWSAILYKVIAWHRIEPVLNEQTGEYEHTYYEATEFKIFPFNWIE